MLIVWNKGVIPLRWKWISSFPSTCVENTYLFPPFNGWHSCWKSLDHICKVLFLGFYSIELAYTCVLMLVPNCFNYYCFLASFETRKYDSPNFCSFPRLFWVFRFLWEPCMNFRMFFCFCRKKKMSLEFWQRSHWICRSLWAVLSS